MIPSKENKFMFVNFVLFGFSSDDDDRQAENRYLCTVLSDRQEINKISPRFWEEALNWRLEINV